MKLLKSFVIISLLTLVVLTGCDPKTPEYKQRLKMANGTAPELEFYRYEEVLFNIDTAHFQEALLEIQDQYKPFLAGDLSDPMAVRYLKDFATDPMSISLYQKVKQAFPDLSRVRDIVEEEYRRFNYYYPEVTLPQKVFTCVSGVDPYTPAALFSSEGDLVVSLDWYLDGDEVYDMMGMPQYRSQRTGLPTLAKDMGTMLCMNVHREGHRQGNLLEEMVYAGICAFFVEAMYPSISDEVLLGYTPSQLQWAEDFEGDLWADMVGSQCLYSSELELYRTFLADGPFTNEYSHEAPARLGEFIGLHIVRSYMESHPEVNLRQLMEKSDLQEIFQDSKYKPKK